MKKKWYLLFAILLAGFGAAYHQWMGDGSFVIYLAEHTDQKIDIQKEKLFQKPIISMSDIEYYSLGKSEMKVTEAAYKELFSEGDWRTWLGLVICVGKERIYQGCVWDFYTLSEIVVTSLTSS